MQYSGFRFGRLRVACLLVAMILPVGLAWFAAASADVTAQGTYFLPLVSRANSAVEPLDWPHLSTVTGDLPAPDAPTIAAISPFPMLNDTPRRTSCRAAPEA